jgi:uncharacterized protein YegL
MFHNKIKNVSSIISIALILCILISVLPPSVFGASAIQEPVTKDGAKYADITATAGNSSANLGDKITANGANYDITLDGEIVGSFVFNKNAPYIDVIITSGVAVDIIWNCGDKYADCTLNGAGIYQIPQLLQDNGKTQSFNAIWVVEVKQGGNGGGSLDDWAQYMPYPPETMTEEEQYDVIWYLQYVFLMLRLRNMDSTDFSWNADYDNDGLTNLQEYAYDTNPFCADTDGDELTDYEEIFICGTNPLVADTDGDGVPDGIEIELGLDPKNPKTDGVTLDGEQIFTINRAVESTNGKVAVMLDISLKSKQIASLTIDNVPEDDIFLNTEMWGYIGNAFDFNFVGEFEGATLTFEFEASLLNNLDFVPRIYYWNEEIQFLEELPNQIVSGNTVSVTITHFSSYVLIDKSLRDFELMRFEILPPAEGELQNTRFDLVLVLDESGSISTADFTRMKDISATLVSNLGDTDRISVYTFDNTVRPIIGLVNENPDITNKDRAMTAIRGLAKHSGNTAIYNALGVAINEINSAYSPDASKIIVLLTDGENNVNGITPEKVTIDAKERGIIIYTIGVGSVNTGVLTNIATSTGGKYYSANNFAELAEIFAKLQIDLDVYKDTDNDGISDYHEKQMVAGNLRLGSGAPLKNYQVMDYTNPDSDGDGISDGVEMKIEINVLKINGADSVARINSVDRYVCYAYMYSNPCVADSAPKLEDMAEFGENSDAYRILVDLGNRWIAAPVCSVQREQLHNLANEVRRLAREDTPIQYAQDKVMNQLHANAKTATDYQKSLFEGLRGYLYILSGGNYFEDSTVFLIGMAYGAWDYKFNPEWQVPYATFNGNDMSVDNNRNWRAWMYFDGMLMAGDDFGNLNMAYVGYKMGLPTLVYQNPVTTDGKDAFWVQYGIDMAICGR